MIEVIIIGVVVIIGVFVWLLCTGASKAVLNQPDKKNPDRWLPASELTKKPKSTLKKEEYFCPQCGQSCSKEEYNSGYCEDCDTIEMGLD